MADTGVDIDLYADMESEFPAEELHNDSIKSEPAGGNDGPGSGADAGTTGASDLYDDVLTNIKDEKPPIEKSASSSSLHSQSGIGSSSIGGPPPRRYQVYVGNLTWWTTDADIADAVLSVGVSDFVEVKFYENRANGQSKGFCCVSLATEASMRTLMEKLPKKELHGQAPVVTYATKQALNQFEAQSKTRPTQPPGGPPPMDRGGIGGRGPPPGSYRGSRPPVSSYGSRPPLIAHAPPRATDLRGPPPTHHHTHHAPPPRAGLPLPPPLGAPPPIMTGPPPVRHVPGMMPVVSSAPAPHVNPAFFPPAGGVPGYPPPGSGLSEAEFEEIMARNRTVSSSAIARAVQDAASNDFASSIETLVTAISLIKQSKVAHDDRCRILITSLQDTLHGIEAKSYGSRPRERSRSRERRHHMGSSRRRSYSREREYRDHRDHHRDYYRDRSRSRERDYRREEKYYDESRYKHRETESRREGERERSSRGDDIERGSSRSEHKERERERERSRH